MAKSRIKKNTRVKQREKVKRKKKKKAKKILKGVGKLSLGFLLVAGLAVAGKKVENFFLTSPHFQISEVDFEGLNSLKKETLENLSGIKPGKNIFQVDMEEIRRHLQSHPQVKVAIVSRQFPRKIKVEVEEREAVALVKNDDRIYPVDNERFIVPGDSLSPAFPLITGLGIRRMKVGERIEEAKLVRALEILEIFSSSGLPVSEIALEGRYPVVWIKGIKIFMGKEEDIEKKLIELKSILADFQRRKERAEYIDLRFNNPAVKLR